MSNWVCIGRLDDIPPLGARVVKAGELAIAVFRAADDNVFALEDRCPHKGGPLSQGIVHGGRVTCPLHDWSIDLAVGEAVAPDTGCVRSFPVRVSAGSIEIDLARVLPRASAAE